MIFAPYVASIFLAVTFVLACWRGTRKTSILSLTLGTSILLLLWLTAGDGIGEFKTMVAAILAFYGTIVGCLILLVSAVLEYNQFQKLRETQLGDEHPVTIDDASKL